MKVKALLTAVLMTTTNFAWAGGLSIDNAKATDYEVRDNNNPEIVVQGPVDKFNVQGRTFIVDTEKLRKDYNGQA